jgi:ACDE family multidrug resistance protein
MIRRGLVLSVLSLVPFIMVLGNSMLIPVLPRMMAVLHLSLFQAGLVVTAFSIPAGVTIPLAGALSDRIGRRRVMTPALVIYGIGGLSAGAFGWLAPHAYTGIIASRVVQGIGAGGTYQLAMAVVGDLMHGRDRARALGILEAANGMGKVVAPIAGAALALLLWFLPFFVYGALALPIAWAVAQVVRESVSRPAPSWRRYGQALRVTARRQGVGLGVAFLGGAVVLFSLFGVLSFLSDVLEVRWGLHELARGLIIAVPVLFSASTSFLAGTMLQARLQRWARGIVVGGLALIAAALVAEAVLTNPLAALAALVFQGIGTGAALPSINALVTGATSSAERGVITSLYGSVRFFGVALGPPVFALAMTSRLLVFAGDAALAALAA